MARLLMFTLWPSFLVASMAEGFFFSLFDPYDISFFGAYPDTKPVAVYTVGFFCFWLFCALASLLTCYLMAKPNHKYQPL